MVARIESLKLQIRSESNLKLFLGIVVGLVASVLIMTVIHELGHYIAGWLFYGVSGKIILINYGLGNGYYYPNGTDGVLVHYAGGIFTSLVFSLVYFISRKRLTVGLKMALIAVIIGQLSYGILEGITS